MDWLHVFGIYGGCVFGIYGGCVFGIYGGCVFGIYGGCVIGMYGGWSTLFVINANIGKYFIIPIKKC